MPREGVKGNRFLTGSMGIAATACDSLHRHLIRGAAAGWILQESLSWGHQTGYNAAGAGH